MKKILSAVVLIAFVTGCQTYRGGTGDDTDATYGSSEERERVSETIMTDNLRAPTNWPDRDH